MPEAIILKTPNLILTLMANDSLLLVDVNGVSVSEEMPGNLLEKGTGRGCGASASRSNRVSGTLDLQLQKNLR